MGERGSIMNSLNFYKIHDDDFVFSVKLASNGAIRYYRIMINEENEVKVFRIKNAFAFVKDNEIAKVKEFSPDYARIITSLIDYCEINQTFNVVDVKNPQAIQYSVIKNGPQDNSSDVTIKINCKKKNTRDEGQEYYTLDSSDKEFIALGIADKNREVPFRLK